MGWIWANRTKKQAYLSHKCSLVLLGLSPNRWLAIHGQVGMDREGKIASGVRAQSEQVFRNIAACLEANGMRKEDLVKVTVYLTDARFRLDASDRRRFCEPCRGRSLGRQIAAVARRLCKTRAWWPCRHRH